MRPALAALALFCVACFAQTSAPPASDAPAPHSNETLHNQRVTVKLIELAPNETAPMHRHDHDMISIFINGGKTQNTVSGMQPDTDKIAAGEVRFRPAGYTHSTTNNGTQPLRVAIVEFAEGQGKMEPVKKTSSTCNPDPNSCVVEKYLFCTAKVCVEDVTMAPGAISTRHSHATDHMLIALSDYQLADHAEGKGTVARNRKSGEVEYIPAGITHRLINTARTPAHFIVVAWR